jgi:hypothetical protein
MPTAETCEVDPQQKAARHHPTRMTNKLPLD